MTMKFGLTTYLLKCGKVLVKEAFGGSSILLKRLLG